MEKNRKLNTILFADIAGYTSLMQHDESRAIRQLKVFKDKLESTVPVYGGFIVQYFGDGCLLSFDKYQPGSSMCGGVTNLFSKNRTPGPYGYASG